MTGTRSQILIPPGCLNGHLCLTDRCVFSYKQTTYYNRDNQVSVRYDSFGIDWGIDHLYLILSKRDREAPYFQSKTDNPISYDMGGFNCMKEPNEKSNRFDNFNHPTEAILKYAALKDWTLVIVGDLKTPADFRVDNAMYLTPRDQYKLYPVFSEIMGWNNDCRQHGGFPVRHQGTGCRHRGHGGR